MGKHYTIFVTIQLAICNGIIDKEAPYDQQWDEGTKLYETFEGSQYNVDDRSEYDCIEEFLQNDEPTLEDRKEANAIYNGLPEYTKVIEVLYDLLAERYSK